MDIEPGMILQTRQVGTIALPLATLGWMGESHYHLYSLDSDAILNCCTIGLLTYWF